MSSSRRPIFLLTPARLVMACLALLLAFAGATASSASTARAADRPTLVTENYAIHSDLPAEVTRELARELERCFADYSKRLEVFSQAAPRGRMRNDAHHHADAGRYSVHLFASEASYAAFTGNELPNSAGLFHPGRRSLCAFLEGQGTAELKRTLRHEAFHQFAHKRIGPGLPIWVNEGLAQVFEHGLRLDDDLLMGQVPPAALREVRRAIGEGRLLSFGEMLDLNDRQWGRIMADRDAGSLLYAQAWAMVHFLVYAADANGTPLYRERFNAYLADIAGGTLADQAFAAHFGTNLAGFRQRFETYILALQPTAPAETADKQDVLARMLGLLHERGIRFDDVADFREYVRRYGLVLHRSRNGTQWRTHDDPGVYFLDARGRVLPSHRLRFEVDPAGEMPALVRRPGDGIVYRTRFYRLGEDLFHETTLHRDR
jgi:hypothetical protein